MANVVRWRPFTELMNLRSDMNRLFNEAFRWFDEGFGDRAVWRPVVDMEETKEEFIITAEIPGLNKEDIKISIVDNSLTISGEVAEDKDVQEKNYYLKERVRGKFSRSFTLPVSIDSAKAEAVYKDGLLKLRLPKAEEAKPREISIKTE